MRDKIAPHTRYAQKWVANSGVGTASDTVDAVAPATADESWCAEEVVVSFSAMPTAALLTVEYQDASGVSVATVLQANVTTAGGVRFRLHGVNRSPNQNEKLVAKISNTNTGVTGYITLFYR